MRAASGQRVEIKRKRGDQCFAFAGFHLGDLAAMQNDPAQHLNIIMTQSNRALGCLTHCRKGFGENFFEDVLNLFSCPSPPNSQNFPLGVKGWALALP